MTATRLTAAQLVARTTTALGISPRPVTVDGIDAGDPATTVRGVAVTTCATGDALRRAAASGANVVVTHEPAFYVHGGDGSALSSDPVVRAKRELVESLGLVVWRVHDLWHDRRPDGVDEGTARALGWTLDRAEAADGTAVCTVGSTTLGRLATHVARCLGSAQTRFAGDPDLPVRRVGLDLGFRGFDRNRALLLRPDLDAVVVGEAHEWETVSYGVDAARVLRTGLVVAGHVPSEQAGMELFAETLRGVVDVPVTFLPVPDLLVSVDR